MVPKAFEVDCADITASTFRAENTVDLFEVFKGELVIDVVAASKPSRL